LCHVCFQSWTILPCLLSIATNCATFAFNHDQSCNVCYELWLIVHCWLSTMTRHDTFAFNHVQLSYVHFLCIVIWAGSSPIMFSIMTPFFVMYLSRFFKILVVLENGTWSAIFLVY
jgi:hypothetical protein